MELKLTLTKDSARIEVKQDNEKTPRVALNLKGALAIDSIQPVVKGEIQNFVNHYQEQQQKKAAKAGVKKPTKK